MNETPSNLIQEIKRIEACSGQLANPNYEDWTVTIVDGFDGSWGITLEGPNNFYKILVEDDGNIKGALAGRTGQRGEKTNLGAETLVRLLSGFVEV